MKLTRKDLALFGLIVYFTFIGGTYYSQFNIFLRVANQLIVSLILGLWLFNKIRKGAGLPVTCLDGALALYLAVNFLSAGLGQSPRFSLERLWSLLTHILAFYLIVDLLRRGWTARLAWAFFMASAVVCLVGIVEFVAWYGGSALFPGFAQGWPEIGGWRQPIPPVIYRLAITLNGSTPLSAYLALLIPPALGLLLTLPPQNQQRRALWIWLLLALLIQILTFSRAGILALVVSLALTLLGWLVTAKQRRFSLRFWSQGLAPFSQILLIVAGVVLLGVIYFWFQSSFTNRASSTEFRFVLWRTALTIFQEYPLTGVGPDNFGRALLRLNQADLPRLQIASAHNVYLNTAAELGLVGLLAGGYLLFSLGRAWWVRWLQLSTAPEERLRLAACGAALVGMLAQTLVDVYAATPIIILVAALVAYVVSGLENATVQPQRHAASLALVLLILYGAGFAWITQADLRYQQSFRHERQDDLPQAINQAQAAHQRDPWLVLHTYRVALLEARLAYQRDDARLLQTAIERYQTGLEREPIWGLNSANLSGLLWQQGQQAQAIATMQRTLTAEKEPLYLINLGYFYEQTGQWPEASNAYGQALALAPDLAGSDFWLASPTRAEKWPAFVAEAIEQPVAEAELLPVKLALARSEFASVEALLSPEPEPTDGFGRKALAEVFLSQGALAEARALLSPMPLVTAEDYLLRGRLKLQEGDDSAEKLLKTAVFLGNRRAYYYLGQLYERKGAVRAAEAAYHRGFLPHYTAENIEITIYGRASANDLAPQLVRIGVSAAEAAPWLALARLYEAEQRFEEARRIYEILLFEDPYFTIGQERLAQLETKQDALSPHN